jgi:hypothetical protein
MGTAVAILALLLAPEPNRLDHSSGGSTMKRILFVLIALALLVGFPVAASFDKPTKVEELMQRKLARAQKVLEGVAIKDFDLIRKNAEELIAISKEAEWRVITTPRYELYSNEFRRTAEALIGNAKEKNLDAAALSYVDMTLSCVKCHKHVREVKMASR